METILVTGAAGQARGDEAVRSRRVQQGGTGRTVTEELLKLGYTVRALVRVDDERAEELRGLGAEVVVADLLKVEQVAPALEGVQRAYFTYPVRVGIVEAAAIFAASAKAAGVQRIVDVSMIYAGPGAGITPHMQRHWVAEHVIANAVPEFVHLEAAVFYENMAVALGNGDGKELPLPLGPADTDVPLVASADVARAAISQLAADEVSNGPISLTGEVLTIGAVAEAFGVPYVQVDPEVWAKQVVELYDGPGSHEHLTALWAMFASLGHASGLFAPSEPIEQLGGWNLTPFAEFVASR